MNSARPVISLVLVGGLLLAGLSFLSSEPQPQPAFGQPAATAPRAAAPKRTPWTTSRVVGTPEAPAPLREEVAYPKISFKNPVVMIGAPGSDRWFVGEQRGKVFSFSKKRDATQTDLFLDISLNVPPAETATPLPENVGIKGSESLYGLTFHPQFAKNRFVYACYVVRGAAGQHPDGTRVSRFKVSETDPPRALPETEEIVITWLQGGHNGGCLAFGPDGCLYISTGDGGFANPPDGRNAGQDVSNLLSSVLRIDVDHPDTGRGLKYSIPKDNPFVDLAGARGEIWCYGLRNPWKMKFDRATGDLWVGDVGWELWELVFKVQRAGNYGWSIVEGRQQVHPERKVGPTPILPPTIEIPHTDGVSVTGGYVYRGKKFPELVGSYIFGDWETRRIWASRWDEISKAMTPMQDVVESGVRLVDFAEDDDGELFLLDYDAGTVHELVRNPAAAANAQFPTKLSETGLFESTEKQIPARGVLPFAINAEQWSDHATADRFIGVPSEDAIRLFPKQQRIEGSMFQSSMTFSKQTVLAKTFSLNLKADDPSSRRRIETQLLHYDGRFWRGYTYAWNDEQTDAELVEPHGREVSFSVADAAAPSGRRDQTWHFSSRVECARCHNQWAEYALAFNIRQLNRDVSIDGQGAAQLDHFKDIGLVELPEPELPKVSKKPAQASAVSLSHFENPYRESADINRRARSWLHVNCAHCHRTGGGGAAYLELREELPLEGLKVLDVKPTQGTFEIADSRILSPGNPYRSTLYYRVSKTGSGRMPHIGSDVVDERGVKLIHDWIEQLPVQYDAATLLKKLKELDDAPAEAGDQAESATRLLRLTQEAANQRRGAALKAAGKDDVPTDPAEITDTDRKAAATLDQRQAQGRKAQRAKDRAATIKSLLSSTSNALVLARAVLKHELSPSIREQAFEAGAARPEPQVRDLFEQFLPAERRVKRLGASVRPKDLLALKGDAARGRELFFNTTGIACKNCHRIGEVGSKLGPELTLIAKKNSRAQILDSILEPSKQIDPKYVSYVVQTSDGKVLTGLLTDRNPREIVLRNAKDEEVRIPADSVDEIAPQRQSFMPELLLKDMTAEQVGDLLEFLTTLK